jgi:hypothetical protein
METEGVNMMISACGVICSDCPAFDGAAKGSAHQQRTADAWRRIYGLNMTAEQISCGGCLGPDQELFYTMGNCAARICCRSKGFSSCAECPSVDCADLEKAQSVWDEVSELVHRLSPADFDEYARPYCGHRERLANLRAALDKGQ